MTTDFASSLSRNIFIIILYYTLGAFVNVCADLVDDVRTAFSMLNDTQIYIPNF